MGDFLDNLGEGTRTIRYTRPANGPFGAKLGESCALHEVKFDVLESNPPLVADYLRSRETMQATRQTFTVESPHKCNHCQRNIIDGVALASGQRRFPLEYRLGDAILAAMSGCALYEWVLSVIPIYTFHEFLERSCDARFWLDIFPRGAVHVFIDTFTNWKGYLSIIKPENALMWAIDGNLDKAIDLVLPYERDVGSTRSFDFAQLLLKHCLLEHEDCRADSFSRPYLLNSTFRFPTRLVCILHTKDSPNGDDVAPRVQLVETDAIAPELQIPLDEKGYAALSYCWGGDQQKKLTKANLNCLKQGISFVELPKTLRDAILVTSSLKIDYLWIDALCIIQDDHADKENELSRMSEYYGCSTVTICAASASKCSEGFLGVNGESNFQAGPFQIPLRISADHEDLSSVQLFVQAPFPIQPTARRAWTFQESMLSRRLLIYTSRQLYWSCKHYEGGCRGVEVVQDDGDPMVPGIHPLVLDHPSAFTAGQLPRISASLFRKWSYIVREYTERELSIPDDKLLAISALAQYFATLFSSSGGELKYLAGLWKFADNKQFRGQLLWSVKDPSISRRPRTYRAPSWSWASLDGHADYLPNPLSHQSMEFRSRYPGSFLANANWAAETHEWESRMCQDVLVDHGMDLTNKKALFGAVRGGFIQVHGAIRQLEAILAKPEKPKRKWYMIRRPKTPPPSVVRVPFVGVMQWPNLFPDTEDDGEIIKSALAGHGIVFLLELVPYRPAPLTLDREPETPMGVLLVRTSLEGSEAYRRIGVFHFDNGRKPAPLTGYAEHEGRRADRMRLFFDVEPRIVKIV
ncbi:Heterokaryon incompatibility protein (HET) domain containing protein [Hyaloscypha variabilis]